MKRFFAILFCCLFLIGCDSSDDAVDEALKLRQKLLDCSNCSMDCTVTADYVDKVYNFSMQCIFSDQGNMRFTVIQPDTISGITGNIDVSGGNLTFDNQVLMFPMLADGYISPVCTPWLMMKALRGGYIHSASNIEEGYYFVIHDSYFEDPLQIEIWLDTSGIPKTGDVLWKGRRILTLNVKNFSCV